MRRPAAGLFVALISVASMLLVAPAQAATSRVEQGTVTFPVDEVDTQICGFPINIRSQATVSFTSFLSADGSLQRVIVHFSIAAGTFSAGGVSLPQGSNHSTTKVLFDNAGNPITSTTVGLTTQVFLPDGGVVIEAGRVVEDGLTGTVTFEAGNRLTPEDSDVLCGAFSA